MRIRHTQLTPQQAQWLHTRVGLQRYYLHTGFGGRGWRFDREVDGHYYLTIEDDKVGTMFLLRWGGGE